MVRRSMVLAALLPAVALESMCAHRIKVHPEDRLLGPGAEMRLPANTHALAESLASIARASGVLIGFETMLDTEEGLGTTRFRRSLRQKTVGQALDDLIALHPGYEWRNVNGVIHVRPQTAFANRNHFLNHRAGPLELKNALPLHATFEVHRVFIPDCVVKHPIYTNERDAFLQNEHEAMRQPVTLSFRGGTVIDLLDAIVKAHGSLYWNVTYHVSPERLHDATPRYEYAIFSFAANPQIGGWWRMCGGNTTDNNR